MKALRTSLKANKSFFLFLTILLFFGMVTGFLFYIKQDISLKDTIVSSLQEIFKDNVFSFQNVFYHLVILFFLCILLFCFLGIPFFVLYIFFEGISLGFILPLFFSLYRINFFLYYFLYFVVIKFVYCFLLFFLFAKAIQFIKSYISNLKKKDTHFLQEFKYVLFFVFCIFINDIFVYFLGNKILTFLLG